MDLIDRECGESPGGLGDSPLTIFIELFQDCTGQVLHVPDMDWQPTSGVLVIKGEKPRCDGFE